MSTESSAGEDEGFGDRFSRLWEHLGFPVLRRGEHLGPKPMGCLTKARRQGINREELPKWIDNGQGGKVCPHCGKSFPPKANTLHICLPI